MAMSLTGAGRRGGKNFICGVCREVYRSPRLLPCFHTFCLYCLESVARASAGPSFPCPQCRKDTLVPPEGPLGFQMNFYITEEELELERKGPGTTMCTVHGVEPLVFFCLQCDQSICIRCKLTKHDHHTTDDLSNAAARCQGQLELSKDRLEGTTSYLDNKSAEANDNLKAAKQKGLALKQEVKAQRDALVDKVDKLYTTVLAEVDQANTDLEGKLSSDAQTIQKERDSLLQLGQRMNRALQTEASDAEKVSMEKEMREGQGSGEQLDKVKDCVPQTTLRPGLHYDCSFISEYDIRHFLGSPVQLSMPCEAAAETIVSIYQCGQDEIFREVHNVCYVTPTDLRVSYGGTYPDYEGEQKLSMIMFGGKRSRKAIKIMPHIKGRVTFLKYGDNKHCYAKYNTKSQLKMLQAKSGALFDAIQTDTKTLQVRKVVFSSDPFTDTATVLFKAYCGKPNAFDATNDGELFVIVEEESSGTSGNTKRNVRLFQRGQTYPFTTYRPSDTSFDPSDVCFWQEQGVNKLLVADQQNDCVHVVTIVDDQCQFERYLAAGNGHLVRPTALDVDDLGNVWIGCGNGWILRCEKLSDCAKSPVDGRDAGGDCELASVRSEGSDVASDASRLMVENSSRTTDVQSLASED